MSITLKRPMFRRGGSTNTGIMSGLVDRTNYSKGGFDIDRIREQAAAIERIRDEISPIPKTRLPIGSVGLALASGIDPIQALTMGYDRFVKADDIRRAQLAKRGKSSTDIALQTELKRLEQKPKTTRLLTASEKKDQGFNESDVVEIDAQGNRKVLKTTPAGEVEKRATRKTVISSIDKILGKVDKQGTGFFEGFVKGLTTPISSTRAKFEAEVKGLELNVIKALRGAQVSAAEEENVKKILPSVFDSETMFKAKGNALKEYLQELDTRIEGGVVPSGSKSEVLDKVSTIDTEVENLEIGDDGIYDLTN
tara:strand:- start:780 stop:1706 length:927 start_codon:yes stop_codon:yes gene_type:complete